MTDGESVNGPSVRQFSAATSPKGAGATRKLQLCERQRRAVKVSLPGGTPSGGSMPPDTAVVPAQILLYPELAEKVRLYFINWYGLLGWK
ncbi:MAG: hypothetical protein PHS57_10455 [Alphaproteobacteria bacterium]|nr:hypothetical protein [Alphaproteobacteria bacterium]